MAGTRHDDRFRALVHRRLEPGETIVTTARVWTARPSHVPVLAARYRDDVVVTDRRLMVWACAWFTRRARRRVLAERLDQLVVTDTTRRPRGAPDGQVTRVRIDHQGRKAVVFEVDDEAGRRLVRALLAACTQPHVDPADTPA